MNVRTIGMLVAQVGLAVGLSVGTMRVMAEDSGTADAGTKAAVAPGFTFQGRLDINGVPADGACDFTFQQFDAASGGAPMSALESQSLTVQGGVFTTVLTSNVPFLGEARWVEVAAGCGTAPTLIPGRIEITAVPYALSLRTPAQMHGDTGQGIIHVFNTNPAGEGVVSSATRAFFTNSTTVGLTVQNSVSDGIQVSNAGADGVDVATTVGDGVHVTGASGDGVDAVTTNAASVGGRFVNAAAGGSGLFVRGGSGSNTADIVLGGFNDSDNAGRIISDPAFAGSDLFFFSNDQTYFDFDANDNETGNLIVRNGTTQVFEIRDTGGVRQADTAFGIPKLAMRVNCSGATSSITTFKKGSMTAADPTENTPGTADPGECSFDAGFSLNGHYIVALAASSSARTVTYASAGSTIQLFRWGISNSATPVSGSNGTVDIIIY